MCDDIVALIRERATARGVGHDHAADGHIRLRRRFGQRVESESFVIIDKTGHGGIVHVIKESDPYIHLTFRDMGKQQTLLLADLIIGRLSRPDLAFLPEGLQDIWAMANSRTCLRIQPTDVDADRIAHGIVVSTRFASTEFAGPGWATSLTIREGAHGLDISDTHKPGHVLRDRLLTEAISLMQTLSDNEIRDDRYAMALSRQVDAEDTRTALDRTARKNVSGKAARSYAAAIARLEMADVVNLADSLTFTTPQGDAVRVEGESQQACNGKASRRMTNVMLPGCDEPLILRYPGEIRELMDFLVAVSRPAYTAVLPQRFENIHRMACDAGLNVVAGTGICDRSLVVEGLAPMRPGATSGWMFRHIVPQDCAVCPYDQADGMASTAYPGIPEDTMAENEWLALAELTIDQLSHQRPDV